MCSKYVPAILALGILACLQPARSGATEEEAQDEMFSQPAYKEWWEAARVKADTNQDGQVDEAEKQAAQARMAEHRKSLRQAALKRFDADGDGKLAGKELEAFKQAANRHPNFRDRLEDIRDRKENVRDRKENVADRREDVRDRREDIRDRKHDGGARDELEDYLDRMEDVRDHREDIRDRKENVRDRRENRRDRQR